VVVERRPLSVEVAKDVDTATLKLTGELDLSSVELLTAALDDVLADATPVVIDLRELDFLDSSGLRAFVALHHRAEKEGFSYRVIAGPPQVHRTFVMTGLDRILAFES
jgi:anti-anti-sigma factor